MKAGCAGGSSRNPYLIVPLFLEDVNPDLWHGCGHEKPAQLLTKPPILPLYKYGEVPAADLFSFALVEFIAADYGTERLLALLHQPDSLESELGASRAAIEQSWRAYMQDNYQ